MNKTELRGGLAPSLSGRRIEGYAIVFNAESELMKAGNRYFKEVILPSSISMQMLNKCDIRALINHDKSKLLARWNKGKGSLSLSIDSKGLAYSFEAPKTADGDFAVEMVKRGDVDGCSFAFNITKNGDTWEERKDGTYLRTIKQIARITDVTLTADPAYLATSVGVRSKGSHKIDNLKSELESSRMRTDWRAERAEAIRMAELNILNNNQRIREDKEQSSKAFQDEMDAKREAIKRYRGRPKWYI